MNRLMFLIFFSLFISRSYGQADSTLFYVGFTPQYLINQAIRLDFEMTRMKKKDVFTYKISPYLYRGINENLGNERFSNGVTTVNNFVSGTGLEGSIKLGVKNTRSRTVHAEFGVGYHHINIQYTGDAWTEIEKDGNQVFVLQEQDVVENVRRTDFFFLFCIKDSYWEIDRLGYTIFFGPVIRVSNITSNFTPRVHRNILQPGKDGVAFRLGVTLEGMVFSK